MNDEVVPKDQVAGTPSLIGKTYLQVLDVFVDECRKRNILVLFDNHRMDSNEPEVPDIAIPAQIKPAFRKLAVRYCDKPLTWNVIGVDLKNEPQGRASWGTGADTDWDVAAADIGNDVLEACPRWLIFVEGVQNKIQGITLSWGQSGGSLQGAKAHPVKLSNMKRLVYSPHALAPSVDFKSPWWVDESFPNNMAAIYQDAFGFIPATTGNAVVMGAWGAQLQQANDKKWATHLAKYLADEEIGSFYWAFNPQAGALGGLVDDSWKVVIQDRVELLQPLLTTNIAPLAKQLTSHNNTSGTLDGTGTSSDVTACDGIDCGASNTNAGCQNGQCVCLTGCIGDVCTPCSVTDGSCAKCGGRTSDGASSYVHSRWMRSRGVSTILVLILGWVYFA